MKELIVALDVDTPDEAHALARALRGAVGGFKIGSQLFTSHGPSVVSDLVSRGDRVFLDLKFHDIPNTVGAAAAAAARLGVWMLNVHASGGSAMMRSAADAARGEARRVGKNPPLITAVTVLTSLDAPALAEVGIETPVASQVEHLAALAQKAGLDGVIASPRELPLVRARCGSSFLIVTPGIRGADDARGDQQRTMSADDALAAGANYLVVGRPITKAPDPRAAAEQIARICQVRLQR